MNSLIVVRINRKKFRFLRFCLKHKIEVDPLVKTIMHRV